MITDWMKFSFKLGLVRNKLNRRTRCTAHLSSVQDEPSKRWIKLRNEHFNSLRLIRGEENKSFQFLSTSIVKNNEAMRCRNRQRPRWNIKSSPNRIWASVTWWHTGILRWRQQRDRIPKKHVQCSWLHCGKTSRRSSWLRAELEKAFLLQKISVGASPFSDMPASAQTTDVQTRAREVITGQNSPCVRARSQDNYCPSSRPQPTSQYVHELLECEGAFENNSGAEPIQAKLQRR